MTSPSPHQPSGNIPLDKISRETVLATRAVRRKPTGNKLRGKSRLADMIRAQGFTSVEIQRITGINWRRMTHYTNGEWRPHVRDCIALCDALDCDPEDIMEPVSHDDKYQG